MANSSIGYEAFLREKIRLAPLSGFECAADEINPLLKPHQRDIVQWAVRGGSRAIFAAFGQCRHPDCSRMRHDHIPRSPHRP